MHIMDTKTRLSAGVICEDTSMVNAVYTLQIGWLTPFWTHGAIRGDDVFNLGVFTEYVKTIGSKFGPVPPHRHQKCFGV